MPQIENWSLIRFDDEVIKVVGEMYEHPEIKDGSFSVTSAITSFNSDTSTVITHSTNVYKLGKPLDAWMQVLKEEGTTINELLS